jgi:glycerol-1-phosphate dehydrogenase [NAD(P)+]
MDFHFRELLGRFGGEGRACACGSLHSLRLQDALIGEGALEESADRVSGGPHRSLWVLSDGNTEAAAGARWKGLVRGKRIASRVLPAQPRPVPTEELAAELSREVRAVAPDLVVAVGSGVVCDLGKVVSRQTGIPNWALATAVSVDAYASGNAPIRVKGYHTPVPATPSEVVICDLRVLAEAPRLMLLAGLGDLLAKYLAHIDWLISHHVTGELFCGTLSEMAVGAARAAIRAIAENRAGGPSGMPALADAVVVSGLCMQAQGGSRPAAAAEHTIAHFWEMADAVTVAEHNLHGLLVGTASRSVLRGYSAALPRLRTAAFDPRLRREALVAAPAVPQLPAGMARFRATIDEVAAARAPAALAAERLRAWQRHREEILERVGPVLADLAAAVETLERLGFPFGAAELGIAEPWRSYGVRYVRQLRARYTTFDLAHDIGQEEELIADVLAAL